MSLLGPFCASQFSCGNRGMIQFKLLIMTHPPFAPYRVRLSEFTYSSLEWPQRNNTSHKAGRTGERFLHQNKICRVKVYYFVEYF